MLKFRWLRWLYFVIPYYVSLSSENFIILTRIAKKKKIEKAISKILIPYRKVVVPIDTRCSVLSPQRDITLEWKNSLFLAATLQLFNKACFSFLLFIEYATSISRKELQAE